MEAKKKKKQKANAKTEYVIIPKLSFESDDILADSPEDAMDEFAVKFDTDLNNYFEVVEKSKLEIKKYEQDLKAHERVIKMFMRDELENEFDIPEDESEEYAELAYEFYCDEYGTEYECIEKAAENYEADHE